MFDRCRSWRRRLSQRADGALPVEQWGALDDHLARCARCRAAERADSALRAVMGIHTGVPDPEAARVFDNRVLAALRAARSPMRLTDIGLRWVQARWNALPLAFLSQVAGGALVAASLTALCLQSATHATAPALDARPAAERSLLSTGPSEAPVPLEALLQSQTPRAAWIWTTPSAANIRPSAPTLPARNLAPRPNHRMMPSPAPEDPQQHGGLAPSMLPG
ncbi:MAG TPA: zf-HC2 domain-containing protein [Chthonomonadaceae bacterium]|nr:zf-HC2 domain-containing protein [Chthonomonadaceae bacterium]